MAVGPSGWIRTTTSRVKSPACCVHTTKGIGADQLGANGGIRTRTSRLGRPAGDRYPTFALVRPTGIAPVPSTLAPWNAAFTPRPNMDRCYSPAHRHLSVVKDPTRFELVGSTYCPFGDSARIRTRTHEFWRLGCSRYTTLSMSLHRSTVLKTKPPSDLARSLFRVSGQNKKGLLGDRPRRPVSL
jgi:hypothetical protein